VILGIDPGASGALAWLTNDGSTLRHIEDMPVIDGTTSASLLAHIIRSMSPTERLTAVVEHVGSMPGQGVASTFKFGASWGIVLGVLAALDVPYELVRPNVWKRAMALGKDKGASRALACRMWPESAHLFARVKDDGRAEAALLARWGVEHSRMVTR
jgi:hypothetical protein